jgi:hypothetical protein
MLKGIFVILGKIRVLFVNCVQMEGNFKMCERLICKREFSLFNHYNKCKYSKVSVKRSNLFWIYLKLNDLLVLKIVLKPELF